MDLHAIRTLLHAVSLDDVAACRAEIAAIRSVRGMLDAREMAALCRLDELAATPAGAATNPDHDHAAATKKSTSEADKVRRRSRVADDVPQLGDALGDGDTTGERLDIVARATSGMSAAERARFAVHGDRLRHAARDLSDREFRALVDRLAAQARDDDGVSRLERQKRAVRLRWWTDSDGMRRLDGRFDPESGLCLEARIRKAVDALFHGAGIPDGAPNDPIERQHFLAAHALMALVNGGRSAGAHGRAGNAQGTGTRPGGSAPRSRSHGGATPDPTTGGTVSDDTMTGGTTTAADTSADIDDTAVWVGVGPNLGPDITVVIDARTFLDGRHDTTRLELGLGLADNGLPIDTIRRWACLGTVTPVVVAADGARILLGREKRLANRHQRRALRVIYATCALCDTAFEHCDIHHLHPWETGGRTDIDNLLPLCSKHHHLAHEGGWRLRLDRDRTLRVTRPGGGESVHAPPRIRAA